MPGLDITDQYIRARQVEPGLFDEKTFKTIRLTSGIKAIIGNKKGEKSTSIQSILFDKKKFTASQAKAWLAKHNSKFSDALNFETQKMSLFDDMGDGCECGIPRLSPAQVERLLELVGPGEEEEDDEEPSDEEPEIMKFAKRI
jgi:hypothetical protein